MDHRYYAKLWPVPTNSSLWADKMRRFGQAKRTGYRGSARFVGNLMLEMIPVPLQSTVIEVDFEI
jgi:hypothetical protein